MTPLTTSSGISLRQTPAGRLLNYGTFTLHSVGLFHPLRRIRYLPCPNELYLRAVEEAFEPSAVEARMVPPVDEESDGWDEMFPRTWRDNHQSEQVGPGAGSDSPSSRPSGSWSSEPDVLSREPVSRADLAAVEELTVDVVVVDRHPLFHLRGCVELLGFRGEAMLVGKACELGFAPCGRCEPVSRLMSEQSRPPAPRRSRPSPAPRK